MLLITNWKKQSEKVSYHYSLPKTNLATSLMYFPQAIRNAAGEPAGRVTANGDPSAPVELEEGSVLYTVHNSSLENGKDNEGEETSKD